VAVLCIIIIWSGLTSDREAWPSYAQIVGASPEWVVGLGPNGPMVNTPLFGTFAEKKTPQTSRPVGWAYRTTFIATKAADEQTSGEHLFPVVRM